MTEWVTIKIPETVRDKAKDDNRAYHEIMSDGLEGINTTTTEVVETDTIKEEVLDIVTGTSESEVQSADEIMRALETIEQRTGRLERQIEELGRS